MEEHADVILGHATTSVHPGGLIARGSAAEPIVFSGWSSGTPSAGIWPGLTMHKNADPETRLEHVRIEYAGQLQTSTSRDSTDGTCAPNEVGHAALEIDEFTPTAPFKSVEVANVAADALRIFGSQIAIDDFIIVRPGTGGGCGDAIEVSHGSSARVTNSSITGGIEATSDMLGLVFAGNEYSIYTGQGAGQHRVHANLVGALLDASNTIIPAGGTLPKPIIVEPGTVSRSAIWPNDVKYTVRGDVVVAGPASPFLMLEEDLEWTFSVNNTNATGRLIVGSANPLHPGGLIAIAPNDESDIYLHGTSINRFGGISFLASAIPGSTLRNVRIDTPTIGVTFDGHQGEIVLENSEIQNPRGPGATATGDGILVRNASPRIVGNTISTTLSQTDDGIDCIGMGAQPVIRGNELSSINGGSSGTGNDRKIGISLRCNAIVEQNSISGFHYAIRVDEDAGLFPTTAVVRNNSIDDDLNGTSFGNNSSGPIDARLNWWGQLTGPIDLDNSGEGATTLYNPWLAEPASMDTPSALQAAVNPELFPGVASGTDFVVRFPQAMNWFIDTGTGSPLTLTFSGSGQNVDQAWSGLGNGNYQFEVRGATQAGAVAFTKIRGTLEVNDVLPEARIDAPDHLVVAAAGDAVAISGEVDSAAVSYALEVAEGYSQGFSSSSPGYALLASGTAGTGAVQSLASWNTTGLAAGAYTVRLRVTGAGGTTTDSSSVLILSAKLPVASVPGISPNGDQVLDKVNVSSTITMDSNWTLDVLNGSGGVVKSTSGTGRVVNYDWAGDLTAGGPAPDGPYRFRVTATEPNSAKTVSATSTATTTVDLTAPTASISAPTLGTPIVGYGPITVTGSAGDSGGCSYSLSVGAGESPVAYTPVATGSCPKTAEGLGVLPGDSATYAEYDEGLGRIKLRVVDQVGNAAEIGQVVQFDRLRVDNLSIAPEVFNPESGAQAAISFELNRDVLGVTLQVLVEATRGNRSPNDVLPVDLLIA